MEVTEATASFSEFATLRGFKKSYVTELKAAGRLVLTDDCKRVRVAESIQRIADTKDPSKTGVARRHEAERAAKSVAATHAAVAPEIETQDATEPFEVPGGASHALRRAKALADKAEADAQEAIRNNMVAEGKLLSADDVLASVSAAGTFLRSRLESLPDVLGPQLAPVQDEATVRAILAEAIEHALEETSRQFSNIVKVLA